MGKECTTGRVTIPTDVDVVPETLELVKRAGRRAGGPGRQRAAGG